MGLNTILRNSVKKVLYALLPKTDGLSCLRVLSGPAKGAYLTLDIRLEGSYWLGTYDSWILSKLNLADLIPEGSVVWDCGSYVGFYAAVFRNRCGPHGQVHAFEASDTNFRKLSELPKVNNWPNVHVHLSAVGQDHSVIDFVTSEHGACKPYNHERDFSCNQTELVVKRVPCAGIDELVFEKGIPVPSFMKLDLESAEIYALHNGDRVFSEFRPKLLLEVHGEDAKQATSEFLTKYDYVATRIQDLTESKVVNATRCVHFFEESWLMLLCTPNSGSTKR